MPIDIVPTDHGVQDRIVEVSQRRIGGHAGDADIEAAAPQLVGESARPALDEVAAIRDATDDAGSTTLSASTENSGAATTFHTT